MFLQWYRPKCMQFYLEAWAASHTVSSRSHLEVKLLSDDLFAQAPQVFGRLGVIGMRLQWFLDDVAVAKESARLCFGVSVFLPQL